MSRIAIFSDVHGNLPALEAVLEDLQELEVGEVLVGGDLVGRGPEGDAVARRIRETGWRCIRGNHEDYLIDFRRGRVPDEWQISGEWAAARWMAGELSEEILCWLEELPEQLLAQSLPGLRLVHGSPCSANEGLGPWCSDQELAQHLSEIDEKLLVCAHTHRPMDRSIGGGRVVNIGSVGLPFNRDTRAQYAIFQRTGSDHWEVERRRVPYALDETLAIYETSGFLAEGGATAQLLFMELEHAAPFLVPFIEWSRALGREPDETAIPDFLDFYELDQPFSLLFQRLKELQPPPQ